MHLARLVVGLVAGVVLAALPGVAWAQEGADVAARRELLEQAQRARADGDHARALDLAGRAGRITMTASVRRFIAEEELALGRLADALGDADLCVHEAERDAPSRNRDAVLAGCRALHASLLGRIGRIEVQVPSPPPEGLQVTVAGRPLNEAFWGAGYVVTPGELPLEAEAPGYAPFRRTVTVTAGATVQVRVALERRSPTTPGALSTTGGSAREPVATRGGGQRDPGRGTTVQPGTTRRVRSAVGPVLMALGAALAAGGAVSWFVAEGDYQDLRAECPPSRVGRSPCLETDSRVAQIRTLDTLTNLGLFAGAGAFALGVALYFAVTHTEELPAGPRLAIDPSLGTVGVAGAF